MNIDIDEVRKTTWEHYIQAKGNMELQEHRTVYAHSAISDVIPGFKAEKLEFGSYDKGNFAVLFVDMRRSTERAQKVGPKNTFLTMHIFLTALLKVVEYYQGKVIDIMGDGLMEPCPV